ncbi:tRNA lysidine(34) synthetase TilS [Nonomuraea roseoviolacea]|uniref:tRNA(Ile)-lysidine synthase n=1 Tax=Nonomuraea roseoviolacea subsp. carminata TaxID=160689 RepID=A0ABT1K1D7_9ACTN|nr:tRNA lysidine(34) synthetase TilS [Nonomuraea roseoviolacea]MCP2347665.1 tRNA(Ile)-lysidine synthase [Nonomuraea roseoviolacea subsp. carminata]
MGPHPAVADVRRAVREALAALTPDVPARDEPAREKPAPGVPASGVPASGGPAPEGPVLVACSGGADSLALAAALGFVAPRAGLKAGLLTVDHQLQPGSAERAEQVAALAAPLGLDMAEVLTVEVGTEGGPEAAAREARYRALAEAADRLGARAVLLGHTRDDQAETVLLGLARGSGPRSISGMAARSGRYLRPFLDIPRATTVAACRALGLTPWDDPHNEDPRFTRVRVRARILPLLEAELGPGVAEALARTAALAREDADALDEWADRAYQDCALSDIGGSVTLSVPALEALPGAVRRRVLRRAAVAAGSPPGSLSATHVRAVDRLVTHWRGQKPVDLPGGRAAVRRYGTLIVAISPIP